MFYERVLRSVESPVDVGVCSPGQSENKVEAIVLDRGYAAHPAYHHVVLAMNLMRELPKFVIYPLYELGAYLGERLL